MDTINELVGPLDSMEESKKARLCDARQRLVNGEISKKPIFQSFNRRLNRCMRWCDLVLGVFGYSEVIVSWR